MDLTPFIRDVPDFPKPGIVFKDITPLLADARALEAAIDALARAAGPLAPDLVIGAEAFVHDYYEDVMQLLRWLEIDRFDRRAVNLRLAEHVAAPVGSKG